jgi:hypothetical protein
MFHLDRLRTVSPRRIVITVAALAATAGGGGLMLSAQSVSADRPETRANATPTAVPTVVMTPNATASPSPGDKDIEHEACKATEPAETDQEANDQDSNDRAGSDDVCAPGTTNRQHDHEGDRGPGSDASDGRDDGGSHN